MNQQEVKLELAKRKNINGKYMMGTKAYHLLGDISSDKFDLFIAKEETDKFWIGNWVTGFGFIDVLFPKETSRGLNQEEIDYYNNSWVRLNSQPPIKLNVSNDND